MRKLKNNELGRISVEEFKQSSKTPITVILDNIRSLNNVGSVFRTSDAFLIDKIYLCGITATPPNKEIHKTLCFMCFLYLFWLWNSQNTVFSYAFFDFFSFLVFGNKNWNPELAGWTASSILISKCQKINHHR